jgi:pheromone shutdown protein TraB
MRKMLSSTEVAVVDMTNGTKKVHFIKMHHLGQQHFYDRVEQEVRNNKEDGYVLFYEWIDYDKANELTLRKTRKLMGFIPSEEGYQQMVDQLDVDGVVAQNNEQFLNLVNDKDYKADITPEEVIRLFEERHGVIELSNQDMERPLDETIEGHQMDKRLFDIILDYRNQYLAQQIHQATYDKIIVLYGADHQSGVLKELQKLDADWHSINN